VQTEWQLLGHFEETGLEHARQMCASADESEWQSDVLHGVSNKSWLMLNAIFV
jgi:hypothetical protein